MKFLSDLGIIALLIQLIICLVATEDATKLAHGTFMIADGKEHDGAVSLKLQSAAENGINFCNGICYCYNYTTYVDIRCDGQGLTEIFQEADFQVTFDSFRTKRFSLSFSDNQISNISVFPFLSGVRSLTLNNNPVSIIQPKAFSYLPDLRDLSLRGCELTEDLLTDKVFSGNTTLNITRLDLSGNQITSINEHTFDNLIHLDDLILNGNPFKTLAGSTSSAINSIKGLRFLYLSNTGISEIPSGMLHNLPHFQRIDLSKNLFRSIPDELSFTTDLQQLNMQDNLLEILNKDSFRGLDNLKYIYIGNNSQLTTVLNGTFGHLKNLFYLSLNFCPKLETWSCVAFDDTARNETVTVSSLRYVDVNNNSLSEICETFLPWDDQAEISIHNNPFHCDCGVKWIVKKLLPNIPDYYYRNITCATPEYLKGTPLNILDLIPPVFQNCTE